MTINSRKKGRLWQTVCRQWWEQTHGCVEAGGAGIESTDLILLTQPVVSIECKNQTALDLAGWVDQAVRQAPRNAIPAVMHKRRGRGDIGDCYVTMRAEDFRRLLS